MAKFNITGMGCAACAARIEKAVNALTDVDSVSVNLLTNSMTVEGSASDEAIVETVKAAGYGASKIIEISEENLKDKETKKILKRFIISIILLIPLMYLSMAVPMLKAPVPKELDNTLFMWCVIAGLSFVIIIINIKFFISGFKSLIHLSPNMDLLVSIGSGASFIYSVVWLINAILNIPTNEAITNYYTDNFFFDSAAMILVLVTIGKLLESKSKARTTSAIAKLMKLSPVKATLYESGVERVVNVEEIHIGNIFVVKPGDRIPVDGIVIDGGGAIDESMISGESIPANKDLEDEVYGGTININGYLRCRATSTSANSTLAEIIKLTANAAATKAPIARLADRVAAIFVPTVAVIAIFTFVVWMVLGMDAGFSLSRAVSVLVISCPCALGLATPVAIMVASGRGAKLGILFKSGEDIEKLGKIKTALIDKTGTITSGNPCVTNIITISNIEEEKLLEIAYAVESRSKHPLSIAITKVATEVFGERKTGEIYSKVSDFSTLKSSGVKAIYEGKYIIAGNAALIESECGIDLNLVNDTEARLERLTNEGKTPLYYVCDGILIGVIAVADAIKEDSKKAIKALDKMNIESVMLTGDNEETARAIASESGIKKIIAGVKPEGKIKAVSYMIEELSKSNAKSNKKRGLVAMVGDGINDAPALAKADVGVAIAAGSDVAASSADVILMKNRLTDFVRGIKLSKVTIRIIKENLFFAFCYNIIGIPLAAGVLSPLFGITLSPMFGAACMSASSILVVLNALRISKKKIDA